jgi:hypothetical protein
MLWVLVDEAGGENVNAVARHMGVISAGRSSSLAIDLQWFQKIPEGTLAGQRFHRRINSGDARMLALD